MSVCTVSVYRLEDENQRLRDELTAAQKEAEK